MPVWNKITDSEVQEVRRLFLNTSCTIEQIAGLIGRSMLTVHRIIKDEFTTEERRMRKSVCYRNSKQGAKNPYYRKYGMRTPSYKGGSISKNGYLIVCRPVWYTGRATHANVFAHHVVACLGLGLTEIPAGYQVHHCDGNKLNNWFNNLVLLTMGAHTKLHWAFKKGLIEGATTISKESTLKWVEAHGGGAWHRR